jgi:uncharacterized protein YecT (DUF1311 family)
MARGKLRLSVAAALLTCSPGAALAASFDCAKARAPVEQLICGNASLSDADERLGDRYMALLKAVEARSVENKTLDAAMRDRLRAEQRAWLERRTKYCGVPATLPGAASGTDDRHYMVECLKETTKARTLALDRQRDQLPVSVLIEPKTLAEKNEARHYEVDVRYPVLAASVPGADAFNKAVEQDVLRGVEAFRASHADEEPPPEPTMFSALSLDYEVSFASPKLLSVQFDSYDYPAGAAHGMSNRTTLHVDLTTGRTLTAADIFAAGSGWEKALTEHCLTDLRHQARDRDFELNEDIGDSITQSVTNLDSWRLEDDRAVIIFTPYQVAAYAVGTLEVPVSYALLRPYLKPDAPLPPRR